MSLNGIQLRCGSWEAEVLPFFGANLISLKKDGHALLRTPDSMEQLEVSPYLYGNPLLFPPNRTAEGKFCFEGKEYFLPINEPQFGNHLHGLLYNALFQTKNYSDNSVVCFLKNEGELFPFCFTLEISFTLDEEGLTQRINVHNDGDHAMPVLLAFHTSFATPECFSVPIGKRWEIDSCYIPTEKLTDLNEQELLYRSGCHPDGKVITGFYTAENHTAHIGRILYETSPKFTQWILYNGGGKKGFLCVEPQTGCVNGLNMPGEHLVLSEGETAEFWLRFTLH